jgi:hypothetical protein
MPRKRNRRLFGVLLVVAIACAGLGLLNAFSLLPRGGLPALSLGVGAAAAPSEACSASNPTFYFGFADLHARLGAQMGAPVECEQSIHSNGDTRQRTTTGYAYYRKNDNVPTFTDGWQHWALTRGGMVYWTGDVVDPPRSSSSSTSN